MRVPRILLLITFIYTFNCFFSPAGALNLDYYGIESRINPDTTVESVISLRTNTSVPSINYILRYPVSDLTITSEYAIADCEKRITDITNVSCTFLDHEEYENMKIELSFRTDRLVEKMDDFLTFEQFVPIGHETRSFFHMVYLPSSATLSSENLEDSVSPATGKTLSDGKHIMVYWDKEGLEKGEDLYFSVIYTVPENGNGYEFLLMFGIAVVIIFSLGFIYLKTTHRSRSMKVIMPLLKGDERVVVDILKKHGGSAKQRRIVRESDFSKAKVSRIVAGLKERGIVGVEILGRTNRVTLKTQK